MSNSALRSRFLRPLTLLRAWTQRADQTPRRHRLGTEFLEERLAPGDTSLTSLLGGYAAASATGSQPSAVHVDATPSLVIEGDVASWCDEAPEAPEATAPPVAPSRQMPTPQNQPTPRVQEPESFEEADADLDDEPDGGWQSQGFLADPLGTEAGAPVADFDTASDGSEAYFTSADGGDESAPSAGRTGRGRDASSAGYTSFNLADEGNGRALQDRGLQSGATALPSLASLGATGLTFEALRGTRLGLRGPMALAADGSPAIGSLIANQLVVVVDTNSAGFNQVRQLAQNAGIGLTVKTDNLVQLDGDAQTLASVRSAIAAVEGVSRVESPTYIKVAALPNDPSYGSLYGLNGTFGVKAEAAWNTTVGSTKVITAVVDTGIDYNHPDLYLNIWLNQGEIPPDIKANLTDVDGDGLFTFWDLNDSRNKGAGKANDVNGDGRISGDDILASRSQGGWADGVSNDGDMYVDDFVGWNFDGNNNRPMDGNSHGTHVAGTIGAIGNNGTGVTGINWKTQMMAMKALSDSGGGSTSSASASLIYASDHGSRVSNNSYSGSGTFMAYGVDYARQKVFADGTVGHIVVAAAGNSGRDADLSPEYPAAFDYENVVSVAATTSGGGLAGYSNYGANSVDVAALGDGILSTTPGGGYGYKSGTSMATPHAAGVVALMLSATGGLSAAQAVARLRATVTPVASLAGKVASGGIVSAASFGNLPPVISPIADQTLGSGQSSVTVPVSATDPEGKPVTFSASGVSQAYYLDQSLGLYMDATGYSFNYAGRNEKWMRGNGGDWYFILPTGDFYKWDGTPVQAVGTLVASLGTSFYNDPALLHDATPGSAPATVTVSGSSVTVTPNAGFTGTFAVMVTASDGSTTASKFFLVTKTGSTPSNQPPVLSPILSQSMSSSQTSLTVPLSATDPNGDPLTFSASVASGVPVTVSVSGSTLTINPQAGYSGTFTVTVTVSDGKGGTDTKSFSVTKAAPAPVNQPPSLSPIPSQSMSASQSSLTVPLSASDPDGDPLTFSASVAGVSSASAFGLSVTGTSLTITPPAGFSGTFTVTVTASDGKGGTDSKTFSVTKAAAPVNQPPSLSPVGDQTMSGDQTSLTVPLTASDPDGDPLTFSGSASASNPLYQLDQQLGLNFTGNFYLNYGGKNEKWLLGNNNQWYFILPTGQLYAWNGQPNQANGTLVATLDASVYADPSKLYAATPTVPVSVTFSGNTLTITPPAGFTGTFTVTVTVSDGKGGTATQTFSVTKTAGGTANQPPVLSAIPNQSMSASQGSRTLTLSASDPNGDALTYSATTVNYAYYLDQQLGFFTTGNQWLNWGGKNEKWVMGNGNQWYFILPTGQLYAWDGSPNATGTLVATLDSSYWTNLDTLFNATNTPVAATVSVSGNQLTVAPSSSFRGTFVVSVSVSDGKGGTDTKLFLFTVTN